MKPKYHTIIGNIGQWLSVIIMCLGIYYLIRSHIDYGTILFSIGCIVDLLATKTKYYGDKYLKRNKNLVGVLRERRKFRRNSLKKTVVDGACQEHYY